MNDTNKTAMMESPLAQYINSFPEQQHSVIRQKIANALGITEIYVRSMCNGNRKIPKKYAVAIHKITHGCVPYYVIDPNLSELEKL